MGLDLSAGSLCASLLVSSVGTGLFLYGKKQVRMPQLLAGLLLMGDPVLVSDPLAMLGIGAAVVVLMVLVLRSGA